MVFGFTLFFNCLKVCRGPFCLEPAVIEKIWREGIPDIITSLLLMCLLLIGYFSLWWFSMFLILFIFEFDFDAAVVGGDERGPASTAVRVDRAPTRRVSRRGSFDG